MNKSLMIAVMAVVSFFPSASFAAVNSINGLTGAAQILATTSAATTTMHMKIVKSGTTINTFQWDSTPWLVNQGGTGTTSFSNGSVLFYNNGFSESNSNLFWASTTKSLSVGTSSPTTSSKLTVSGSIGQAILNIISSTGISKLFVSSGGNVGVGNASPQHALDVSGAMYSRLVTATTTNIDWNAGNVQTRTLNIGTSTLTFSNAQAGGEYKLILNQDATGGRTVTWPASAQWPGGVAPSLTSTASGTDIVSFIYDGSRYLGSYRLDFRSIPTLLSSLISYWKLDESSGNAADSVGSNTLTNNNSTPYTSAKINNGILEVATNANDMSSNASNLGVTSDFSVAYWIKFTSLPPNNQYVGLIGKKISTPPYNTGWIMYFSQDSGVFNMNLETRGTPADATKTIAWSPTTGAWYHVVWTYNASAHQSVFYVDGSANSTVDQVTTAINTTSDPFRVGTYAGSYHADAAFDEIGIWGRTLTSGEISALYNSGNGLQYPF